MPDRKLYTPEGEKLTGTPWDTYPRPQMRRSEWFCLNGTWSLETPDSAKMDILVPFCPESILSGFEGPIECGRKMRYTRHFTVPETWKGSRIILHFGAVSNRCRVYVNRNKVCEHENGYLAFEADITDALNKEPGMDNLLEVIVINDLGGRFPTGKQRVKRGGMWYTPVSGIWQSVWLEPVPERHIKRITIKSDERGVDIVVEKAGLPDGNGVSGAGDEADAAGISGVENKTETAGITGAMDKTDATETAGVTKETISCEGREYVLRDGRVRIEPEKIRLWSPESPHLYVFTVKYADDVVESYFALRSISVKTVDGIPRLCLNGKPYFFHGLLDQGYFSDGIYTPASSEAYENDIRAMKELGFNTLRKHIKIEPEQFYYDCDRLGMVVFQDMVNNGGYSFFKETLLPTIGVKHRNDKRMHKDPAARAEFIRSMEQTVEQLYDHPCICYWTIFNEGWGQFESDKAYDRLKSLDDSRIIDSTSGWFHGKKSDVDSLHVYFKKLKPGDNRDLPQVISEFGGYVYKIPVHSYNLDKTYGYKILPDRDSFVKALRQLYTDEVLPLAKAGLSATIYTQVSDVEDETNGLLTYDRRESKLKPEDFLDISRMITGKTDSNIHGDI